MKVYKKNCLKSYSTQNDFYCKYKILYYKTHQIKKILVN